jgi:membrane protein DedA with SNARE-associated domain
MIAALDRWISSVGPGAYAVLALCALIEYVFPPFPGDTVVLLGGVYAVRGQKPWGLVLAVVSAGSVAGAAFDYWIGTRLGHRLDLAPEGRLFLGITHAQLRQMQERMRRSGPALIALNRFLPAVRGILFLAAGAARLPFRRVISLGALSALVWNALLLAAGVAVGGNAERLEQWFHRYEAVAWGVLAAAALALMLRWLLRRRAAPAG